LVIKTSSRLDPDPDLDSHEMLDSDPGSGSTALEKTQKNKWTIRHKQGQQMRGDLTSIIYHPGEDSSQEACLGSDDDLYQNHWGLPGTIE
jgi:hypothetical protein